MGFDISETGDFLKASGEQGKLLLAISGGIDSMCMADIFLRSGLPFAIAHCNFNLRGAESDADMELVRRWADVNGIACHIRSFDTRKFASDSSVSIEMAARELRYRWFADLCRTNSYAAVCVAHNANDNAETLFLNMIRGAGLKGISGMSFRSRCPYSDEGGGDVDVLRPLLNMTRRQIEGYVRAHRIDYRDDRSNFDTEYRRNRIRNQVFPIMERMNPSFIRTVNREMKYFSQAAGIAETYCRNVILSVSGVRDNCTVLDLNALLAESHWEYVLYMFLEEFGFNSAVAESLSRIMSRGKTVAGKRFSSGDFELVTSSSELIVRPVSSSAPDISGNDGLLVKEEGEYFFNGKKISVRVVPRDAVKTLKQPSGTVIVDAEKLTFPFVFRTWRNGDWLIPLGMKGKKKISDLFTDLKYDIFRKSGAVIIQDNESMQSGDGRVAALMGERIDDRYKVVPSTRSVAVLSYI